MGRLGERWRDKGEKARAGRLERRGGNENAGEMESAAKDFPH